MCDTVSCYSCWRVVQTPLGAAVTHGVFELSQQPISNVRHVRLQEERPIKPLGTTLAQFALRLW